MAVNYCRKCGLSHIRRGSGRVPDPNRGWRFWKTIVCPACGGDGYAKPLGWPDKERMAQWMPSSLPPPPCRSCTREVGIRADTPLEALKRATSCGEEHPTQKGMFATEATVKPIGTLLTGTWWKPWTWRRTRQWDAVVTYREAPAWPTSLERTEPKSDRAEEDA